jgi:hypothetical protein
MSATSSSIEGEWDDSMGCSSSDSVPNLKCEHSASRKIKSVSFASSIDVKEAPHLKDVPEEDVKAT